MNREHHSQYNTELINTITLIAVIIIGTIFLLTKIFVAAYKEITIHNTKLTEAKIVNADWKQVYDISELLKIDLENKNILNERKKIYSQNELETQRKAILIAQTNIAKTLAPPGTYIYLKDMLKAVRVKSLSGYQAETYEGIMFMTTETDKWYTLSYNEYRLCKKVEEKYDSE